jgi:hypothetical protein
MIRTSLLVVHLVGVAAWLGANFVQLFLAPFFARRSTGDQVAWVEATMALGQRYYNVAGSVIGFSGAALVVHGSWSWSSAFIWVGFAALAIGAAMGLGVFVPLTRQQLSALRDGSATQSLRRKILGFALLDTAIVLTAMVAMLRKWGVG